jgi:Flp pilus assembly protein TadG
MTMLRFFKRLGRDVSGLSAIEFAFIAPVMVTSYFGVAELGNYILADRKVTTVASTAADLVAQSTQISNAGMNDIMASLSVIIQPFNANDVQIRITSVTANAVGNTTVAWSDAVNTSPRAVGSSVTLPAGLVPPNQSVIWSEISFSYTTLVGMFLNNGVTVTDNFYLKPRKTIAVQRVP